jgi:anti-sigma-K factor RskA
MGLAGPEEAAALEARMAKDEELALLVARLEYAATIEARAVPPVAPPPGVRSRLMKQVRPDPVQAPNSWGLALAAGIAVLVGGAALVLYSQEKQKARTFGERAATAQAEASQARDELKSLEREEEALRGQLSSTDQQVASLKARDALSQIKIATLTSQLQNSPQAIAFVAWDAARQRGLLKTANLPAAGADKDYQLWIIDPAYKMPVNAGVLPVGDGAPAAQFRPLQPITKA